jgi:hypothetical protein
MKRTGYNSPGDGDETAGARGSILGRKAELMSPMPTKKSSKATMQMRIP